MAHFFYAGNFPSCRGLYSRAVACSTNQIPHFHVVDGGTRLNTLLEPEPVQEVIPHDCIRNFCTLMMASNGEMSNEIQHLSKERILAKIEKRKAQKLGLLPLGALPAIVLFFKYCL